LGAPPPSAGLAQICAPNVPPRSEGSTSSTYYAFSPAPPPPEHPLNPRCHVPSSQVRPSTPFPSDSRFLPPRDSFSLGKQSSQVNFPVPQPPNANDPPPFTTNNYPPQREVAALGQLPYLPDRRMLTKRKLTGSLF